MRVLQNLPNGFGGCWVWDSQCFFGLNKLICVHARGAAGGAEIEGEGVLQWNQKESFLSKQIMFSSSLHYRVLDLLSYKQAGNA